MIQIQNRFQKKASSYRGLYVITLIMVAIVASFFAYTQGIVLGEIQGLKYQINEIIYTQDYLMLKNSSNWKKVRVNGLYLGKGYYCVLTKNRDEVEIWRADPYLNATPIQRTAIHEITHAMFKENYKHYCKDE